jgi:hypothetical protein
MLLADGVNMPWTGVAKTLLALAVPLAASAIAWFATGCGPTLRQRPSEGPVDPNWGDFTVGVLPLLLMVAIWLSVRLFPTLIVDPASPLILVVGGLAMLGRIPRGSLGGVIRATFTGTPLALAAALVAIGIVVQVMTLTGVRGWLVISTMTLGSPLIYPGLLLGMPLLGGALTSMVVADVMGVPAAFWFIGQDMIVNVAALSAIASLAEFVPPTSIAAALACYVVGGGTVGQVARRSWPPMALLAGLGVLMLLFAPQISGFLK